MDINRQSSMSGAQYRPITAAFGSIGYPMTCANVQPVVKPDESSYDEIIATRHEQKRVALELNARSQADYRKAAADLNDFVKEKYITVTVTNMLSLVDRLLGRPARAAHTPRFVHSVQNGLNTMTLLCPGEERRWCEAYHNETLYDDIVKSAKQWLARNQDL